MIALLPAVLRFAPWALAGVFLLGALFYRGQYLGEIAARAEDRAAAEQARTAALEDAQARSDAIITQQAQALAATAAKTTAIRERIIHVPVSTACVSAPAVQLGIDGVRSTIGSGGGGAQAE